MVKKWTLILDQSGCFELFDENNSILATIFGEPEKAYLMEAAPDLLEALEAYQRANPIHNDSESELYDLAEKAIAKAKGETTNAV